MGSAVHRPTSHIRHCAHHARHARHARAEIQFPDILAFATTYTYTDIKYGRETVMKKGK